MSFRLNTQHFFLTYPQCPLSKETLLAELQKLTDVEDYVICRERHETGEAHLHAYLRTSTKHNYRKANCLDVLGFHGNYQGCRSPLAVKKYVEKDGDFIANIDIQVKGCWKKAIGLAKTDAPEAIVYIQDHYPRDYFLHCDSIMRTVAVLSVKPTVAKFTNFAIPDELSTWDRKRQALYMWGESGLGKTELAKFLLGSCYLCSELDALKEFDPLVHTGGIIFDDLTIGMLPKETILSMIDLENTRQVKCRYRNAVIPEGTPRIFTANCASHFMAEWWNRRVFDFNVIESLKPEPVTFSSEDMQVDETEMQALLDFDVNDLNLAI